MIDIHTNYRKYASRIVKKLNNNGSQDRSDKGMIISSWSIISSGSISETLFMKRM